MYILECKLRDVNTPVQYMAAIANALAGLKGWRSSESVTLGNSQTAMSELLARWADEDVVDGRTREGRELRAAGEDLVALPTPPEVAAESEPASPRPGFDQPTNPQTHMRSLAEAYMRRKVAGGVKRRGEPPKASGDGGVQSSLATPQLLENSALNDADTEVK